MPEPTRIKICGITDPDHCSPLAALDVWAIGLVFADGSPRQVTPERAREISDALPDRIARVGVFVDAAPGEVARVADAAGLTHVQVHGRMDAVATRAACRRPVIAGVAVAGAAELASAADSPADIVLLDAAVPGRHGGTGQQADWSMVAAARLERPFLLAGGLRPDTVADGIRTVRPWGVDVSSGVESARGVKDLRMVEEFVAAVREAAVIGSGV